MTSRNDTTAAAVPELRPPVDEVQSLSAEELRAMVTALRAENQALRQRQQELEQQVFEADILCEIARDIFPARSVSEVLRSILAMVMGKFGILTGLVVFRERRQDRWELATQRGFEKQIELPPDPHLGRASLAGEPVDLSVRSVEDLACCALLRRLKQLDLVLWIPLSSDGELLGGLALGRRLSGEPYNEDNLRLLRIIASNSAMTIKKILLFHEALEKERIEAENRELRMLDKKKSDFVNIVAHELRTPLTSITGFTELMLRRSHTKSPEKLHHYYTIIHREADRLGRIINNLLDLSRIQSGKVEMDFSPTAFAPLVDAAIDNLNIQAENRRIRLTVDKPEEDVILEMDRDKMTQVLINLLSNAIKYTPEGGAVTVSARETPEGLVVSVADTGEGIPQHELTKIFEEFHRIDNAVSREQRGTGLGLTITKSIVEAHGGRIWVESAVGEGSTFSFFIPRDAARRSMHGGGTVYSTGSAS